MVYLVILLNALICCFFVPPLVIHKFCKFWLCNQLLDVCSSIWFVSLMCDEHICLIGLLLIISLHRSGFFDMVIDFVLIVEMAILYFSTVVIAAIRFLFLLLELRRLCNKRCQVCIQGYLPRFLTFYDYDAETVRGLNPFLFVRFCFGFDFCLLCFSWCY